MDPAAETPAAPNLQAAALWGPILLPERDPRASQ